MSKIMLMHVERNYHIGEIVLRVGQWRQHAKTIAEERAYEDPWKWHLKYNGTILCHFLNKVGAAGMPFYGAANMDGTPLSKKEAILLLRTIQKIGADKTFAKPRPSDLVVFRQLDGGARLDSEHNYNLVTAVRARAGAPHLPPVKRIIVVTAVSYESKDDVRLGFNHHSPQHGSDFESSPYHAALRDRVGVLLDLLWKENLNIQLEVFSSSDPDALLHYASQAGPKNLIPDHGGFGRVAEVVAVTRWQELATGRAPSGVGPSTQLRRSRVDRVEDIPAYSLRPEAGGLPQSAFNEYHSFSRAQNMRAANYLGQWSTRRRLNPPHYPELEVLLDKVSLSKLDINYDFPGIVLRRNVDWRTKCRNIASMLIDTSRWDSPAVWNNTALFDFLVYRTGVGFYGESAHQMGPTEQRLLLYSLNTIGERKHFAVPRSSDLVVMKRLDESDDAEADADSNSDILRGIKLRGLTGINRIVIVVAVTYSAGRKPRSPKDFRDAHRMAVRNKLLALLDLVREKSSQLSFFCLALILRLCICVVPLPCLSNSSSTELFLPWT